MFASMSQNVNDTKEKENKIKVYIVSSHITADDFFSIVRSFKLAIILI